jgi:colanic acid/amylovoran biosynthesis protein
LRVVITNPVISNAGDAAILAGIVSALQEVSPITDLVVFDSNAASTAALYPEWNVRQQLTEPHLPRPTFFLRAKRKAQLTFIALLARVPVLARLVAGSHRVIRTRFTSSLHAIASADVVVSAGGTYFVDHYDFAPKVLELRLAAAFGRPIVLWTQSMGPFTSDRARSQIGKLSGLVDGVFFRDQRSRDNWDRVNTQAPAEAVVADAAFTLSPADRAAGDVPAQHAIICIRDWAHQGADGGAVDRDDYIQSVRALASGLLAKGWRVTSSSTCQGIPTYRDDSVFAAEVFAGIPVEIDREQRSPLELQQQLASADLVVTARMHLAILALIQKTPAVAIAYEFKSLELFESLGLGDQVVRIEDISPEWADRLIASLPAGVRPLEQDALTELTRSSREPAATVLELVNR